MTAKHFQELVLSLEDVTMSMHFNKTAFKAANGKIFATVHVESEVATLKLSAIHQSVYCLINNEAIYSVKGKWGLQGWTNFNLQLASDNLVADALKDAYEANIKVVENRKKS